MWSSVPNIFLRAARAAISLAVATVSPKPIKELVALINNSITIDKKTVNTRDFDSFY